MFLLSVATYGHMGTGELPEIMRAWAEKQCKLLGLSNELDQLKVQKVEQLRSSITNILGKEAMETIDREIASTLERLM